MAFTKGTLPGIAAFGATDLLFPIRARFIACSHITWWLATPATSLST
jgi:hypothetical protein